jgi:hypothetical protein
LAACVAWLLLFCDRPLSMEAAANDKDQAKELHKAMQDLVRLNPWIGKRMLFQRSLIRCPQTHSELIFLANDGGGGAHGSRPHVTIVNELTHISGTDFAETVFNNADKLGSNFVFVATNAGLEKTWQAKWRDIYKNDPEWFFQKVDYPAPWIPRRNIESAKKRNPPSQFNRLWYGVWAKGSGDALNADDVEACIVLDGPMWARRPGWVFAAGMDLGVKNDHAAVVVLGCELGSNRVALARCLSWAPDGVTGQVDLRAVRKSLRDLHQALDLVWIGFDTDQAYLMAQDLAAEGLPMDPVQFRGSGLDRMATTMLQTFRSRKIDLYRDELLLEDLYRISIVERTFGHKLESVRDERGHADRATALAIVLPWMMEVAAIEPVEVSPGPEENLPMVCYT